MNDIVTEARTWVRTPYHHQARLKGVGVDCAGLVIGVARRDNAEELRRHGAHLVVNDLGELVDGA